MVIQYTGWKWNVEKNREAAGKQTQVASLSRQCSNHWAMTTHGHHFPPHLRPAFDSQRLPSSFPCSIFSLCLQNHHLTKYSTGYIEPSKAAITLNFVHLHNIWVLHPIYPGQNAIFSLWRLIILSKHLEQFCCTTLLIIHSHYGTDIEDASYFNDCYRLLLWWSS